MKYKQKGKQRGFVLVVSLIFLAIMSLLTVLMFSGVIQDEAMAGNFREKNRAVDAAQSAIDSAKTWMAQPGNLYAGDFVSGNVCNTASANSGPVVCNSTLTTSPSLLTTPTSLPWSVYTEFTPAGMSVATGGPGKYAATTKYNIEFIGTNAAAVAPLPATAGYYRVTATATGGNSTAVTVIQSTFEVHATSMDIGGG